VSVPLLGLWQVLQVRPLPPNVSWSKRPLSLVREGLVRQPREHHIAIKRMVPSSFASLET
jgi:hypothetical protein